jgi:hypothetical protein
MESSSRLDQRKATAGTRKRPRPHHMIRFAAACDGQLGPDGTPTPTDVLIEATDADGETVAWFDDWWWMECLSRWKNDKLTVHILPSPAALLHPVVLHHVQMVRRVAPTWRLVGHCWLAELDLDASPPALARSPYHEVRVIDSPMPDAGVNRNPNAAPRIEDLFGRIRQEQRAIGATLPALVRATESPDAGYDWSADAPAPTEQD